MAKKLVNQIKLQIPAGRANPAPPVGPALGAAGVNIPMFCKEFNARTQPMAGSQRHVIGGLRSAPGAITRLVPKA